MGTYFGNTFVVCINDYCLNGNMFWKGYCMYCVKPGDGRGGLIKGGVDIIGEYVII